MRIVLIFLIGSSSVFCYGSDRARALTCVTDDKSISIHLDQVSDYFGPGTEYKCANHPKIQFEWERFAFYKAELNGRNLSGVSCMEDANLEFKSAQTIEGKSVAVRMWLRELDEAILTIGETEYEIDCEKK